MLKLKKINQFGLNKLLKEYKNIDGIPVETLKLVECLVFNSLGDLQKDRLVNMVIKYWGKKGFPYDNYSEKQIEKEYKKLLKFDVKRLINSKKEIGQALHGLGAVNSFHPQRWEVQCRTFRTPMMNFKDKKVFKKVIEKCIKFEGNPFDITSIRSFLRIYSGTHLASNFRPSVAKFFYNTFCPPGGKVLDPSMGYSGRMFGALCSYVGEYHSCDPAKETFQGNINFLKTIQKISKKGNKLAAFFEGEAFKILPTIKMNNIPFEEYKNKAGTFDLVFTSPPHFNLEKYSDEENQSWKKFSKYQDWINGFMKPFCKISHKVLKKNGYLIVNIAGKIGKNDLEKDFVNCAEDVFGKIHDIYWLQLSKMWGTKSHGQGRNDRVDHKLEPCFIFKKK